MKADIARGVKWCSKCKHELPLDSFGPNRKMIDGFANWCRQCKADSSREWLVKPENREKMRLRSRERYRRHIEEEQARSRARYHANKEKNQARHWRERLRARFGITVEQFEAMFAEQNGRCRICGTDDFQGKRPHVDHCHSTGRVRGLLCVRCNQGLGNFRDSPGLLQAAADYLNGHAQPDAPSQYLPMRAIKRRAA